MRVPSRRLLRRSLVLSVVPLAAGIGIFSFGGYAVAQGGPCANVKPANPQHTESLLANLSPSEGSTVKPGQTVQVLYTDEQPMASSTASITSPTVTVDGKAVPTTVTATSGQSPTYLDNNGGSTGTQCQDFITFQIPSTVSGGSHTVSITAYDSDNDYDTVSFTYNVSKPPPGVISSQSLTPNDEGVVANGEGATGTMTFKLYSPSQPKCSGTPAFQQKVTVSQGVAETSNTTFVATQPGKWRWVIIYSGDNTHPGATSPCGSEYFVLSNG